MARRHGRSYYEFWHRLRNQLESVIVPPSVRAPYVEASRVYTGSAPILRFHSRAVADLIEFYRLLRTIQEFAAAAVESVRTYITAVLEYSELERDLVRVSRSVASSFNHVVKNGNILGIVVGVHGGKSPMGGRREARRLQPLVDLEPKDYIELRTLEMGVDMILEPTRTVRRLLAPLNHTKIYWTRRIY
jgi:hypothetical protein